MFLLFSLYSTDLVVLIHFVYGVHEARVAEAHVVFHCKIPIIPHSIRHDIVKR